MSFRDAHKFFQDPDKEEEDEATPSKGEDSEGKGVRLKCSRKLSTSWVTRKESGLWQYYLYFKLISVQFSDR